MMPYDTYRLYQAERSKSPREIHNADQRAAQLASAVSGLFRAITQTTPVRGRRCIPPDSTGRMPGHDGRGTMARAMEGS
jgi:hypothetical protein